MKRINHFKNQLLQNQTSQCGKDRPKENTVPDYLILTPGDKESLTCGGTANVLPEERKKATFDVNVLYEYLCGGKENVKRRKFIENVITKEYHDMHDKYNNTREEYLSEGVKDFVKIHKAYKSFKPTRYDIAVMAEASIGYGSLNNSHGIFLQTIAGQGSKEQSEFWIPKILNFEITGAYAQTELGHGSNVRGLMTTAVFDKEKDEFVLNTPTLRSIKWWPGALGKVATHCTLYAQVIIDNKEYGLAAFMVQLRNEKFLPLEGVRLGDLGAKVGDNANDTGFLILNNLRIPREAMLCKYKKVSKEGKFEIVEGTDPKVHYTTMVQTRAMMVNTSAGRLAQAATIAVRYSAVRKQGFVDTKQGESYLTLEHKILDHQIQQYRVLKQLATAYALKFTALWMVNQQSTIETGQVGEIANTSLLKELAASSAALKSLTTQITLSGAEDLRKCCGGNGYLLNSGIGALTCDYLWQITAEGEMIVLALYTGRHLVSSLTSIKKGKKLSGVLEYMNVLGEKDFSLLKIIPQRPNTSNLSEIDYLGEWFKFKSIDKNIEATEEFNRLLSKKMKFEEAWNSVSQLVYEATNSHCYYMIISNFISKVKESNNEEIKNILSHLLILFACTQFLDNNWGGYFNKEDLKVIDTKVKAILPFIRQNSVALVDAFGIPDGILRSTIGRYDGNVYEALFDAAQRSSLNQTDPFDGYTYLKPHLNEKLLRHGNKNILGVKF